MNRNREQDPLLGRVQLNDNGPLVRPRWKQNAAFCFVLVTEMLERTAFYGLVSNMLLFLNSDPFDWASYNAVDAIFTFNGISYIMALFGGWLADAVLGKFRTIVLFFVVYIAGYAFWPALSYQSDPRGTEVVPQWCASGNYSTNVTFDGNEGRYQYGDSYDLYRTASGLKDDSYVRLHTEPCSWAVYLSIVLIAIGYGSVRANIIPFGAHQV